ncbi:MAG: hypothetical protein M1335_07280 [Chloroflexi bacterium]|nr:hypothetical protein [Chloroflexota bacterium]
MFAFSFVAVFLTLSIFAFPFGMSAPLALATALVEAFSPFGIDNLTVPFASATVLVLATSMIGK